MRHLVFFILCLMEIFAQAQSTTYDDLVIEEDSSAKVYQPTGRNFALIKSKRGSGGGNRTSTGDSIKSFEITDIVLVYSELNSATRAHREEYNQERWENLLSDYPEFFENYPNYINYCQCNFQGDHEAFKDAQGFYIYYKGAEPPKTEVSHAESKTSEVKKPEENNGINANKETDAVTTSNSKDEQKKSLNHNENHTKTENEAHGEGDNNDESIVVEAPKEKSAPKKPAISKPRRAKNPKACRPPCYENGGEDLNNFFSQNISLSKKQRRQGKHLISIVSLQLNFDGTIKKALVTGADQVLNQQVKGALNNMNPWNPAVKGGVTVKSQVKMTLRYDKKSKTLKPAEMTVNPRPGPKCECRSDAEIFGDDN